MLDERSKHLRRMVLRAMKAGKRGHWGSSASLIEIMRVLYDDIKRPQDKIILSKGHGCLAQYVLLVDKGIIPAEELDKFCHKDGMLGGHPSHKTPGIECDTGALGHGLSIGVGMAIAAKIRKQDQYIFVICGDGEINEGSVWEACMSAAKHKLDNLTLIVDYNKIQSAGFGKDICPLEPLVDKLSSFGFFVSEIDGHNIEALKVDIGFISDRPRCIIAHTIKGMGISFAQNNPSWHYKSGLTEEQLNEMETALI